MHKAAPGSLLGYCRLKRSPPLTLVQVRSFSNWKRGIATVATTLYFAFLASRIISQVALDPRCPKSSSSSLSQLQFDDDHPIILRHRRHSLRSGRCCMSKCFFQAAMSIFLTLALSSSVSASPCWLGSQKIPKWQPVTWSSCGLQGLEPAKMELADGDSACFSSR